jgi:hypothetical protein
MRGSAIKLASLLPGLLLAAVAQASVSLPLPWKQGMEVAYRSSSVQERTRAGKHERIVTREDIRLKISEAGDQGFLQVWSSPSPRIEVSGDADSLAADRRMAQQVAERFAGLPLQAQLDASGAYAGLRNWQQLGQALREVMLPILLQQAKARPELAKADEAKLRALLQPALQRLTTQAAIDSTLGKQVAILNFFTAPSLPSTKPVHYQDSLASPWSADILPSRGSFELVGVDDKAGTVTISWQQAIDPVAGAAAAWKMVAAISGKPLPKGARAGLPPGLVLADHATVVLDRRSGLPLSLVHRREVALAGNKTINTWTLDKVAD